MSKPEMEVRHAAAPEDVARATTDELRARFLVQGIFRPTRRGSSTAISTG